MDLKLSGAQATAAERAAIDALFGAPESRWEGGHRADAADSRSMWAARFSAASSGT